MIWKNLLNFFNCFDPELSHNLAIWCLRIGLYPRIATPEIPIKIKKLVFKNPVGLAAGFDKNAMVIDQAYNLGFGFTEIGSVTPTNQYGNKKPRIFRLKEDNAIVNRNGFNNQGMLRIKNRLKSYRRNSRNNSFLKLGINIGPNRDSLDMINDFKLLALELASYADYISINVSSPNTSGLRDLQSEDQLGLVIKSVKEGLSLSLKNKKLEFPLFLKISPDISTRTLSKIIKKCVNEKVTGLIISNTTVKRPINLKSFHKNEVGGLSGEPLFKQSTKILLKANEIIKNINKNLFLIANGGVEDGHSAYIKILSGAHLVQLYTGFVYKGPSVAKDILFDLKHYMKRDNFDNFDEIRGIAKSFEEAEKIAKNGFI